MYRLYQTRWRSLRDLQKRGPRILHARILADCVTDSTNTIPIHVNVHIDTSSHTSPTVHALEAVNRRPARRSCTGMILRYIITYGFQRVDRLKTSRPRATTAATVVRKWPNFTNGPIMYWFCGVLRSIGGTPPFPVNVYMHAHDYNTIIMAGNFQGVNFVVFVDCCRN